MSIEFERKAAKQIQSLHQPLKGRIQKAILALPNGDIVKLAGYLETYRLRVGVYRIIFELSQDTIIIKAVLPRGSAYKGL